MQCVVQSKPLQFEETKNSITTIAVRTNNPSDWHNYECFRNKYVSELSLANNNLYFAMKIETKQATKNRCGKQ